jgi:hypothetical protein
MAGFWSAGMEAVIRAVIVVVVGADSVLVVYLRTGPARVGRSRDDHDAPGEIPGKLVGGVV